MASNVTEGKLFDEYGSVFILINIRKIPTGIRNTTTVFDQSAIDRVRIPRYISNDGILRVSYN